MTLLLLFLTGLGAGIVDAIAGGGGLITIPVLLSTGMPPSMVLGTNKLQGSVGTLMAASHFYRRGFFSLRDLMVGLIACVIGAALGACAATLVNAALFRMMVPYLLFIILAYMIISPRLASSSILLMPRMSQRLFYVVFGLLLGFYDGFFGPGTGSFWVFAFMFFLGFDILKATAQTKLFNLTSNVVALSLFVVAQCVDYKIGFCMAAGQWIGGQVGARLAIYQGAQLIRPLFLTMVCVSIAVMWRAA